MNIDYNKYIVKLGHCIFLDGYRRSIIYDIGRNKFSLIPKSYGKIINKYKDKTIQFYYDDFGIDYKGVLDEFFSFLIKNEYIYVSSHLQDVKRFTPLNKKHHTYSTIHNAIIDIKDIQNINMQEITSTLEFLNCQYIQLRYYQIISLTDIYKVLNLFDDTQYRGVDIIAPYHQELESINFEMLFIENQRISSLVLYNSPISLSKDYLNGLSSLQFVEFNYLDENNCGFIYSEFFSCNQPHYLESQHHNTCLNRKLCIDKDGYIKNCPSMKHHYGHISDTNIEDIVQLPEFQKWWHIKKDDIDVCKDCEFRHMCTDCRAFIKDPENIYSQPAKCPYNPYICKWEGEEGYVPVEECGTYTRETGFVPNKRKINKLNKQIWGE